MKLLAAVCLTLIVSGLDPILSARLFEHEGERAFKRADYERALELLKRATTLDPALAEAHFAMADALMIRGYYGESVLELGKGLKLDSRWPERDYGRYGQFKDAAELDGFMEKLAGMCAKNGGPDAWALYAYNLYHTNQKADAARAVAALLKARPRDPVGKAYRRALALRGVKLPDSESASASPAPESPKH